VIERQRALFPMYHPAAALHNQKLRSTLEDDARKLGDALEQVRGERWP
jgi:uracil-DNA glycosylase